MRYRDDRYPLQPLSKTELIWQADGSLLPSVLTDDLLLQVRYRATGRQPGIEICPQDGEPIRQFFEANSSGLRFLNLTGVVCGGDERAAADAGLSAGARDDAPAVCSLAAGRGTSAHSGAARRRC